MRDSIINSINTLPPLPESVTKIQQVCNDPEGSIADIVKIVEKDPMLTANLLKSANSPLYGFSREITSVGQAVSLFGMATVRGFALSSTIRNHIPVDMSPYGLTVGAFAELSQLQSALMTGWYSKVDRSKMDILAPSSFLCEIGRILIAKEVINEGKKSEFLEAIKEGQPIDLVEEHFVEVTSEIVTAKMFDHWKLEQTMVNSIANAINPDTCDMPDITPYAYALKIVRTATDLRAPLSDDNIEQASLLCDNAGLNSQIFLDEARRLQKHD